MLKTFSSIQKHILSKLKNAKMLRYRDLHPNKVPNDLFNYHLQFLVKKGLVNKLSAGYCLSDKGIKYVADPYPSSGAITSLFKMNVITVVSRVHNGKIEILNQLRKSNPSYGKISTMGGSVLKGERIEDAAERKLKEETGLHAKFKLVAAERRILYKSGELFADVIFPIAYADTYSGELLKNTAFGENIWVPIGQAIKNESAEFDSIKSIARVLRAVKNKSIKKLPFFFEENIQSDSKIQK